MADSKISALTNLTAADPISDMLPIVDVSDTPPASGNTKRISINNILSSSPTASGNFTITGDLTVDTNTLKVDSANNRVLAGLTSGSDVLSAKDTLGVVASSTTADINFRNSSLTAIQRLRYTDATGGLTIGSATGTSYAVELGGNTTTRAVTIDASSNVGIGVTPSTGWRAGSRALQLGAAKFVSLHEATNGSANLAFGAYESGSNAYSYTTTGDAPSRYSIISGRHEWYTAPSGTAGTAITFTQAMTLDASGRLGVGITNPSFRIHSLVPSGADADIFAAQVLGASNGLRVSWNHSTTTLRIILANIPTSSAGLASGTLWNDAGTIKIA